MRCRTMTAFGAEAVAGCFDGTGAAAGAATGGCALAATALNTFG